MYDKMKSRKFWFAVWAAFTFTTLGALSVIFKYDTGWLSSSMFVLAGIPAAYVGLGIINKPKE